MAATATANARHAITLDTCRSSPIPRVLATVLALNMIPALPHRALYAAFDRFPSRKGSAVHIDRFARALFEHAGGGLLYVLGGEELPAYQREGDVEIVRYLREAEHVLERAAGYGERLAALLDRLPGLELVHFRDPWSGIPLVEDKRYTT